MSIFQSSKALGYENDKILGPTGGTAIPEFGTSFVRGMLEDTTPDRFDLLVGMDSWNIRNMNRIVGNDPDGKQCQAVLAKEGINDFFAVKR